MALYKRGGTWWMNFWVDEQHVQKSTKCKNKRDAAEYERAYRTQLAKGEVGLHVEKKQIPTLTAAMNEFLNWSRTEHAAKPATTRRYEISSKALLNYFGEKMLDQISSDDVEKFKQWRSKQKKLASSKKLKKNKKAMSNATIKPATVNRELACLKALFNVFKGSISNNPVSGVKFLQENNENFVVLSSTEEKIYLMACSQPLQDVAALILDCGCRPEEIYRLQKKDVNLSDNFLVVQEGKTKAARRRIPLTARAGTILKNRMETAKGDYLFAGGRKGKDSANPVVKLNNAHYGALRRTGLNRFRIYDLRHTFASRMAMAGVDLLTLAALLGHSRVQMVMRYAHPAESHKIDAVAKLESFNAAKQTAIERKFNIFS
jgi:integrase